MASSIYVVGSTELKMVLALANELRTRHARIVSINRPLGFTRDPDDRVYEIWFEHEQATDPDWRDSLFRSADCLRTKGVVDEWAGAPDPRPGT